MGNVNLPTPVVIAGGALCLLGGYLVGVVAGPSKPAEAIGVVESYDRSSNQLCLSGESAAAHEGADDEGVLCGMWRRSGGSTRPTAGQDFYFVAVRTSEAPAEEAPELSQQVLIYGGVVD